MADPLNGGLTFETPPEYMIDSQRERIRKLMFYEKSLPVGPFNEPMFFVSPHCKNMIDTLQFQTVIYSELIITVII